jgi:hypothetical protein
MSAATVEERDRLEARLHDGWSRIEQADAAGQDVAAWESFWIALLREYEAVSQRLDALNAISHEGRSA